MQSLAVNGSRCRETGLTTSCCLASVAWLNLDFQSCPLNDVHCYRYPDHAGYPGAQQAVGVAIAVLNKMVHDTDNQKKVEDAENETALCFTRHTYANIRRISSLSSCLEVIIASESPVFYDRRQRRTNDGQNELLNPACAYDRMVTNYKVEVEERSK